MRVGWTRKKKHKKGYHIFHFCFCLGFADWWSVHYKVRGHKRIRPEKLIQRQAKKEEINYFPYNLSDDLMNGWIELGEDKANEIMNELKRRDKERLGRMEQLAELLKNTRQEV